MKKVLILLLVFTAVTFAAQADKDGDVLLTAPNDVLAVKAAVTDGFTVGTRATTEIMRDMWVGSDFDADGNKEVLIASYGTTGKAYVYEITADNTAELFFDTGDLSGGYSSSTRHVAYGDLDGNGMQELLVSVNATGAGGGLFAYEYDTVGDSMRAPVQLFSDLADSNRWYVENFFVDDVDGDGVQEIMFGNNASTSTLDLFYIASVDSGDFASGKVRTKIEFTHGKPSLTYTLGGSPYGAVTSDIDGNGNKEVLFAGWDHGAMLIVEADSADVYTVHNYIQTDLDRRDDFAFYDFAPADLDGDGRDEVYLSMYDGGALYCVTCPVGTELAAMSTANVHKIDALWSSGGVCTQIGDFDGNGRMNIYASNGGSTITVHEFVGDDPTDASSWVKIKSLTDTDFSGIYGMRYAGDFDGDGKAEIYACNTGSGSTAIAVGIEMAYDSLDFTLTFDDGSDVANWSHYDGTNGYTVEAWSADSTLMLSDGGYGFLAKRPVVATPGWLYKLSIDIKTSLWEGALNNLDLSVEGFGNDGAIKSCISDSVWTTFTIIGVADSDSGYISISGYKSGTVDTVFVDNVVWDEGYLDVYPSGSMADAKAMPVDDIVACTGVVTATTIGAPIFMQDETAGIALYDWDFINDGIVKEGDEILVIGKRAAYNGLEQISNIDEDYIVLSEDNPVEPTLITVPDLDSRDYQGMLVILEDIDTVAAGISWPAEGSDASITLMDADSNEFVLRIDKDGNMDGATVPAFWPLDLVGVIGEYYDPQVMPRYMDDFHMNSEPGPFTILHPVDGDTVSSFDDPNLDKILVDADSVWALYMNWSEAVDPDLDIVDYQVMISPDGPEEELITQDTLIYIPIDNEKPWSMNGSYDAYVVASDSLGGITYSDTITFTFDFPAPPEIVYSDIVLVDGTPKLYAVFNMEFEAVDVANFMIADFNTMSSAAPTALDSLDSVTVMLSGDLIEDHYVALAYSGIVAPGGTVTTADTAYAGEVLIPFSENHREDAINMITDFESDVGSFLAPNWSGSTTADDASTFAVSDEEAYRGTKSGKMTIVDNTATTGGWYVRELYGYPFAYTVKANSKLMFMVKGTDADVEIRLSITENPGYEQGPWTHVSVCENDWQVVSFDLLNDEAEGWINGNGIVEGETVEIEGIHIRCDEDKDVVLYIDEFTERKIDLPLIDVTMEVNMAVQSLLGNFNIGSDFVDVAGSFNGWGDNAMVLDDSDGDSVYSYTITGLLPGEKLEYKFRINGSWDDATCEFPGGGPNRTYVVPDTNSVVCHWYNDEDRSVLGIDDMNALPKVFALHQNYPNPFNPITTIKYELPKESLVKIIVFDLMGKEVRTLVSQKQNAGYQTVIWDALDNFGRQVSSGYYIYLMQAESFHKTQKMILLK